MRHYVIQTSPRLNIFELSFMNKIIIAEDNCINRNKLSQSRSNDVKLQTPRVNGCIAQCVGFVQFKRIIFATLAALLNPNRLLFSTLSSVPIHTSCMTSHAYVVPFTMATDVESVSVVILPEYFPDPLLLRLPLLSFSPFPITSSGGDVTTGECECIIDKSVSLAEDFLNESGFLCTLEVAMVLCKSPFERIVAKTKLEFFRAKLSKLLQN